MFVPDMRALAQRFLARQIDEYTFMVNTYGAYMQDEADRHKWGFSRDGLHRFLHECANWSRIRDFDWRKIEGGDFARDWWICAAEAVK